MKTKLKKSARVTVRISKADEVQLKELVKCYGKSKSFYIQEALKRYFKNGDYPEK